MTERIVDNNAIIITRAPQNMAPKDLTNLLMFETGSGFRMWTVVLKIEENYCYKNVLIGINAI
jgi:hypothetical protein